MVILLKWARELRHSDEYKSGWKQSRNGKSSLDSIHGRSTSTTVIGFMLPSMMGRSPVLAHSDTSL